MRYVSDKKDILGIHHVTAIASNPQKNIDFYSSLLGLRLVKLTVNFDDPATYHLYYGDEIGHPGTILTFFPWADAPRGVHGTGQVIATAFLIPESAIGFWTERLKKHRIPFQGPTARFDEQVITFYDPDGLTLELVAHKSAQEHEDRGWKQGSVPPEQAIRGFYSVTLSEEGYEKTSSVLTDKLGFSLLREGKENGRFRYTIPSEGASSIVDLLCLPYSKRGRVGIGTVHHVAWRTPTDQQQVELRKGIVNAGLNATPVIDRKYFHSVYFREPGGILFEIATEPPGFMVDERKEELGTHLVLPSWLESERSDLERILPSVKVGEKLVVGR
jgi:catechol 2,3-dioxygenase-like lactoylglutathione lyase family enzyme